MNIGIYAASSQSGRAYLSDLAVQGHNVYGYCRASEHGKAFLTAIEEQKGIYLKRPAENKNHEASSQFIPLSQDNVGNSLEALIDKSEVIIFAEPSIYFVESAKALKDAGICDKKIPIILSPSRTFTVPEIWEVLGENYPIICFSTCPYSCKAPEPGTSFIKRRKRSWIGSYEGNVSEVFLEELKKVFPQCIWTDIPGVTSLGNIGSVFHPGTYLMNYDNILLAKENNEEYSFYMQGIAQRPEVGEVLEKVDAVRLQIAQKIGIKTIMPGNEQDENEWKQLMQVLHAHENEAEGDIKALRAIRREYMKEISHMVVGVQFWLDYTYGVSRIANEPLFEAIGRTPTYQKMSVPQVRYIEEDVPTGLIPLYQIGKRYGIDVSVIEELLKKYCEIKNLEFDKLKTLDNYSTEYITNYLLGRN